MLALRELGAILREDQRHVRVCDRPVIAERVDDHQLVRRVRQMLLATDYMRDLHERVVDGAGELIRRVAIRLHQDEVAE